MKAPPAMPVIGVLGHYADANHGDDACALAVLHHLGREIPSARFVLFCRFPAVARTRFDHPAFPVRRLPADDARPWEAPPTVLAQPPNAVSSARRGWRARARAIAPFRASVNAARAVAAMLRATPSQCRFLWQSYLRLRDVDLLLVTGSNPLLDFVGGFWGFPITIWKWTVLARLTRTPVAFVSVGAGPIVSKHSGRLLARSLHNAAYVSFRDEGSNRLMREHGFRGVSVVRPDLAHSLALSLNRAGSAPALRVGINPMIVHHHVFWPESDSVVYRRYVESLAQFAKDLIRDGYDVFLYGTQKDDRISAEEIQRTMCETGATSIPFVMPETVDALVNLSHSADVLVTTRFHGAVFGVLTARPTLAICYHRKTREVLDEAGLGRFAFDFEKVDAQLLRAAFDRLVEQRPGIESQLREHALIMRSSLQEQYEHLSGLLKRNARRVPSEIGGSPRADVAQAS